MEKNPIIFDSEPSMRTVDANGYLHVAMTPISKATVNPYLGREIPGWEELHLSPDEVYYGFRPPAELKKAANTFNGLPLLLNHHEESAENPQKEFRVGSTGTDATFDGEYLKNSLSITDQHAIDLINSGEMKELSCAYFFRPVFTPGKFKGMPFDFVMRDIQGNHVALVEEGRAGHDVAVADAQLKKGRNNVKRRTAKDEAIMEKDDMNGFAKCIAAIEAQAAGVNPAELGLTEIGIDTPVESIVDVYLPDLTDEEKAHKVEYLNYMKDFKPAGDEDPDEVQEATDEEPEEEQAHDDEDWLTEKMKDPVFREAFEMGVKYGEKREKEDPGQIDSDHEREGEERYLHSIGDSLAKVKAEAKAEAKAEVMKHFDSLIRAARECAPILKDVNPLAYDSAETIYRLALVQAGYDPKAYKKTSYRDMISVIKKESRIAAPMVGDSNISDELPKNIRELLWGRS